MCVCVYMLPPSGASLPPPPVPAILAVTEHPGGPPVLFSSFPLSVSLMVVYVGQCCSQFVLPCPSPLCPQVHSLHLCLYFCPANRFTSAIFPNSISSFPSPRIPPSICSHGELRFPPSFSLFHSVLSSATRIISPKTSVDFF